MPGLTLPPDIAAAPSAPRTTGFSLPLRRLMSRGRAGPEGQDLPLAGVTVLLVEDSRFAADAIRLICLRAGGRLKRAESLGQAEAHLKTYRPDILLVDLGLPDGRGEDLIQALALRSGAPPVLAISGDPNAERAALAAGAAGFVLKPLQDTAGFLRQILFLLPGGAAFLAEDWATAVPGDPLALQDDLVRANHLLQAGAPPAGRYVADFLRGLARSSGDTGLAEAAEAAGRGGEGWTRLKRLVEQRLQSKGVI